MTHRHKQTFWNVLGLAGLVGVILFFGFRQHPSPYDDAYITFRYARNIALGRGFVYNVGEPVLGTTTPLYTLLLAGFALIWPNLPLVSHALGVLAWAFCALIVYGIGQTASHRVVGLAAAAWIALSTLLLNVLGMETPLYVCLALLTLYLQLKRRLGWAALCAGLTFLMRWDGILVVGVFLFAVLLQNRKALLRASLTCAASIGPWLIYSYVTFGSVFPNSFYAKVGQGWNQELGGAEIGTFGRGLLSLAKSAYGANRLFVLFPIFAVLGLLAVFRGRARWWPLLLWTAAYLVSYMALGVLSFPWYATPLVPALALLAAEGIHEAALFVSRRIEQSARYILSAALLTTIYLVPSVDWMIQSQKTVVDAHSTTYLRVGQWLRDHTPPNSTVAMIEIGIIGYYSDRPVVDTMGLVSPEIVGHLESWLQTLQFAVNYYWPDYVIGLERTAWGGVVNAPWFMEAYTPEIKIENATDRVAPATIYRRREDFPPTDFALSSQQRVWFYEGFSLREFQIAENRADPGEHLHLRLVWQAEADLSADYSWQFELLSVADGQRWPLARGIEPLQGGNPTHQWRVGDQVVDRHSLVIPDDLPPGAYILELIVAGREGPLPISHSSDGLAEHVAQGPIQIGDSLPAPREPVSALSATFADNIRLIGYDLGVASADRLTVSLHWEAASDVLRDYTVFVHLLSAEDELVAQNDSPPPLPTGLWVPGPIVVSTHNLEMPADLDPGIYSLRIGLYHWPDLERQAILFAGNLDATDDALRIGHLLFEEGQAPHSITSREAEAASA